ncbi:phospholipase D family protein [Cryptosporangium phraense]|uniref:Phospholipase n=1 Tax=Cryptosporangium phraense TaxID=2593070 RepID=A0A545AW58_9ACTN|nr:phospholipase D family protein [Cryptosporangium phraense]TQS45562.1 phospholipase [Cryptosporangium phraense]
MPLDDWFLSADERGNPATRLDSRHPDGAAWTSGNDVRPLIHGATYFADLLHAVDAAEKGDILFFTDWRGDPDELLAEPDRTVRSVLSDAAKRGVVVKSLVWRSHLDKLQFSAEENRHLGVEIEEAGGEVLLDMRVRTGGSHHQKFVVVRHPGDPGRDIAYVGGIDLGHSRRDDADHAGDPQAQPMPDVYGERPPWHDVQVRIQGPAVGDVDTVFRERWEDPSPLSNNPMRVARDRVSNRDITPDPLPDQPDDPPNAGSQHVQILRTYPHRRRNSYPFAPEGERSIARAYLKALKRARRLIYLEDQYLWSSDVAACFAEALKANPDLHLIAVVPSFPDQTGLSTTGENLGRNRALDKLRAVAPDRIAVYGPENREGTPVYVHAKVCVIDDIWAVVGSDNLNRRSWTYDSELSCAVIDEERDRREPVDPAGLGDGARAYARNLRLSLAGEHLELSDADLDALADPKAAFDAFAKSAEGLDEWHRQGAKGERPAGRLRPYRPASLPRLAGVWADPLYQYLLDPDGRPRKLRRADDF